MLTIDVLLKKVFEPAVLQKIFNEPCQWDLSSFQQALGWSNFQVLEKPQPEILSLPLPEATNNSTETPEIIRLLLEVFYRGKYSNDDYFTIDDAAEPATELLHGLEFATYALHAGASDEDVIAGMLHDIGRFYHEPNYANKHHHEDGYTLMTELFGQQVGEFCYLHGYAKAMLYDVIPGYPDGMTDVSMKTLILQRTNFDVVYDYLNQIDDIKQRQYTVLKAMLFRIFDDSSKYPLTDSYNLVPEEYVTELLMQVFVKQSHDENNFEKIHNLLQNGLAVKQEC
jgi:predicted HD phosphohydrolase